MKLLVSEFCLDKYNPLFTSLFLDSSLDDIKYVLNPTFTENHIKYLDTSTKLSRAIDGSLYTPGIVGLNNIKANDYCNVVLQVGYFKYSVHEAILYLTNNPLQKI